MAKTIEQLKPRWVFPITLPLKHIVQACPCCKAEISNMDIYPYLERYGEYYCDRYCFFKAKGYAYYPDLRKVNVEGDVMDVNAALMELEVTEHDGRGKAS